ncbi:hypothetical protein [Nostoc sp. CALU 1950]|uniref:hypothetical protein n=1 Tax=Nostoc sp. CALU 1950 TaxID=3104321 RepID=UPI003EBFADF6
MLSMSRSLRLITLTLPLSFMLTSCYEDLKSVEDFGLTSASIQENSSNLSKDIYDSCIRQELTKISYENVEYERGTTLPSAPLTQPTPANILSPSSNSSESFNFNSPVNPYKFPPARIKAGCQDAKLQSEIVEELNQVLFTYVEILGRLASGNTLNFEPSLQAIITSITQISDTRMNADNTKKQEFDRGLTDGLNITQSLLNLYADKQRYEKLKPIIICNNTSISSYIKNLEKIVNNYYLVGVIKEEENKLDRYFDVRYRFNIIKFNNNPERLNNVIVTLSSEYEQQTQAINQKKQGVLAFLAILQQTSTTHNSLANQFKGDMTSEAEKTFCGNYFPKKNENINVSKAQAQKLDFHEIQFTRQTLRNYLKVVKPLAQKLEKSF